MNFALRALKLPLRALRAAIGPEAYERVRYVGYKWFVRDLGYNSAYYHGIESANGIYYDLLANSLASEFQPRTVVDVGCGSGGISLALLRAGVAEIFAFDFSSASVAMARQRGLKNVQQLDMTVASTIPAKGNLCICLEVAEHIPTAKSGHLCRLLAEASPIVAMSAAPPGQGGHLHVNMQPQSFWIDQMTAAGMNYDADAVARLRTRFDGKMLADYDDNLMVFRRA